MVYTIMNGKQAANNPARARRRWRWWAAGILGALILALVVAQPLLGYFIKQKLAATVAEHTNATLRI
jgi:hypothetical protein